MEFGRVSYGRVFNFVGDAFKGSCPWWNLVGGSHDFREAGFSGNQRLDERWRLIGRGIDVLQWRG